MSPSCYNNSCILLHLAVLNGEFFDFKFDDPCSCNANIVTATVTLHQTQQGEAAVHLAVNYYHLDLCADFVTVKIDLSI